MRLPSIPTRQSVETGSLIDAAGYQTNWRWDSLDKECSLYSGRIPRETRDFGDEQDRTVE